MTWSVDLTDSSGKYTCRDCKKYNGCQSRETLVVAQEQLLKINESPLYPESVGWGVVRVTCYGFDKADADENVSAGV